MVCAECDGDVKEKETEGSYKDRIRNSKSARKILKGDKSDPRLDPYDEEKQDANKDTDSSYYNKPKPPNSIYDKHDPYNFGLGSIDDTIPIS